MLKLLSFAAGLIGVFWMAIAGGYAVYWYDRRPADVPKPYVLHVLVFHATFGLPASLKARDDADRAQLQAERDAARAEADRLKAAGAKINARAAAAETRAQRAIRDKQAALKAEVPHVITPSIDARYPLPAGLLRVHDEAFGLSVTPGQPDDAPSPVPASQFAGVLVANGGECLADRERLTRLQAWVRDLHDAGQAKPAR